MACLATIFCLVVTSCANPVLGAESVVRSVQPVKNVAADTEKSDQTHRNVQSVVRRTKHKTKSALATETDSVAEQLVSIGPNGAVSGLRRHRDAVQHGSLQVTEDAIGKDVMGQYVTVAGIIFERSSGRDCTSVDNVSVIRNDPIVVTSVSQCLGKCTSTAGCTCTRYNRMFLECHLLSDCPLPTFCARSSSFDMYVDTSTEAPTNAPTTAPTAPPSGPIQATTFSCNGASTCAIDTSGSVHCAISGNPTWPPLRWQAKKSAGWVNDPRGDGKQYCDWKPEEEAIAGVTFTGITQSLRHACGITSDGSVKCWGVDRTDITPNYLYLGGSECAHVLDPPLGVTFTYITSNQDYTCGLTTNGTIRCWGEPFWSSVKPDGNQIRYYIDSATSAEDAVVKTFDLAQAATACGVLANGSLKCWGQNAIHWDLPAGNFTQVSCKSQCCAITTDGIGHCWGPLPAGTPLSKMQPPADITLKQVSAGHDGANCGLAVNGTVHCWGRDFEVQTYYTPGLADAPLFEVIDLGVRHGCGLTADGTMYCFGFMARNGVFSNWCNAGYHCPDGLFTAKM